MSSLFSAVGKWRCKTWAGCLEDAILVTLVAIFQWSTYTLSLNSCIGIRSIAPMVSLYTSCLSLSVKCSSFKLFWCFPGAKWSLLVCIYVNIYIPACPPRTPNTSCSACSPELLDQLTLWDAEASWGTCRKGWAGFKFGPQFRKHAVLLSVFFSVILTNQWGGVWDVGFIKTYVLSCKYLLHLHLLMLLHMTERYSKTSSKCCAITHQSLEVRIGDTKKHLSDLL